VIIRNHDWAWHGLGNAESFVGEYAIEIDHLLPTQLCGYAAASMRGDGFALKYVIGAEISKSSDVLTPSALMHH
jgi:hypothetical protein